MTKSQVTIIQNVVPSYPFEAYVHVISPLSKEDGGGFLITFPDLPGCMADGENENEALKNARDAFQSWVSARADACKALPEPKYLPEYKEALQVSGKFVARLPKSMHARLANRANIEGVSLNTLVLTFIAEALGRRESELNRSIRG